MGLKTSIYSICAVLCVCRKEQKLTKVVCRLKLESEVTEKEEDYQIFDLKKTSLDNLFYLSYGVPFPFNIICPVLHKGEKHIVI